MGEKNRFACEQLLALQSNIQELKDSIEWSREDSDLDHEYKRGLREALYKANNMIFARCKELMGEQK